MKFCVCNSLFHFFPSSSPRSEVVLDFDTSSFKSFPHAMAPRGGSAAHARDAAQSSRPPAEENKVRQRVRARGASSWNEEWRRRVQQKKKKKKKLIPKNFAPLSALADDLSRLSLSSSAHATDTYDILYDPTNKKSGFLASVRGSFHGTCGAVVGRGHSIPHCRSSRCGVVVMGQPRRPAT